MAVARQRTRGRRPPSLDMLEASYAARLQLALAPAWGQIKESVFPLADLKEEEDDENSGSNGGAFVPTDAG